MAGLFVTSTPHEGDNSFRNTPYEHQLHVSSSETRELDGIRSPQKLKIIN